MQACPQVLRPHSRRRTTLACRRTATGDCHSRQAFVSGNEKNTENNFKYLGPEVPCHLLLTNSKTSAVLSLFRPQADWQGKESSGSPPVLCCCSSLGLAAILLSSDVKASAARDPSLAALTEDRCLRRSVAYRNLCQVSTAVWGLQGNCQSLAHSMQKLALLAACAGLWQHKDPLHTVSAPLTLSRAPRIPAQLPGPQQVP